MYMYARGIIVSYTVGMYIMISSDRIRERCVYSDTIVYVCSIPAGGQEGPRALLIPCTSI